MNGKYDEKNLYQQTSAFLQPMGGFFNVCPRAARECNFENLFIDSPCSCFLNRTLN